MRKKIAEMQNDIDTISDGMTKLLDPRSLCTDDYYSISGEYCGEWAGATLKRLPIFGPETPDEEINF